MTQQKMILNYIQTHKSGITQKDAFEKFGCTRLSAVINALRKKGHKIDATRETVITRYGNTSIARYTYGTD
jgi:hypothetical protein